MKNTCLEFDGHGWIDTINFPIKSLFCESVKLDMSDVSIKEKPISLLLWVLADGRKKSRLNQNP